jgi:hypothetical protein
MSFDKVWHSRVKINTMVCFGRWGTRTWISGTLHPGTSITVPRCVSPPSGSVPVAYATLKYSDPL